MLVVAALGGNALLRRGQPADVDSQRRNVEIAVEALASLARTHNVVVTHGNGPQVGLLALQAESYLPVSPYPLDVLGAESEGMIGYLIEQGLTNRLPGIPAATLLTQVVVDREDPAFAHPSKPIGPVYDRQEAERLAGERGWTVAPDGEHWRRVVPSPEPQRIVELQTIRTLVDAGVLVVCAGGGGIPVTADESGALHGIEAVIDKDHSAALLARELGADALLLLTDVPCVEHDHGTARARAIREVSPGDLDPSEFAEGSMRPKIERPWTSPRAPASRPLSAHSPMPRRCSPATRGRRSGKSLMISISPYRAPGRLPMAAPAARLRLGSCSRRSWSAMRVMRRGATASCLRLSSPRCAARS